MPLSNYSGKIICQSSDKIASVLVEVVLLRYIGMKVVQLNGGEPSSNAASSIELLHPQDPGQNSSFQLPYQIENIAVIDCCTAAVRWESPTAVFPVKRGTVLMV